MPDFAHGRKARILFNGIDLSRWLTDVSLTGGYDQTEDTTFGQGSQSFVTGIRNGGEGSIGGYMPLAADKLIRRILKVAGGRDDNLLTVLAENIVGAHGFGVRCGMSEQEFTSAPGDLSTLSIGVQGNRGVDDIVCLHPVAAETATGLGTTYDDEFSSAYGAVGHLHVQAQAVGTLDVLIQHSPDGTTWATLITFAQQAVAATVKHQRVATATPTSNVDKNVRASWTFGAGGTGTFAVAFYRGKPDEDVS
jgi:hypothetical protein